MPSTIFDILQAPHGIAVFVGWLIIVDYAEYICFVLNIIFSEHVKKHSAYTGMPARCMPSQLC